MSFYRKIDPGIVSARAIRKTFDIAGLLDQDAATDPRALPSGNITDITDSTQQNNSDMAPKTSASAVKPPTTAASVAGAVKDGSETPVTSKIGENPLPPHLRPNTPPLPPHLRLDSSPRSLSGSKKATIRNSDTSQLGHSDKRRRRWFVDDPISVNGNPRTAAEQPGPKSEHGKVKEQMTDVQESTTKVDEKPAKVDENTAQVQKNATEDAEKTGNDASPTTPPTPPTPMSAKPSPWAAEASVASPMSAKPSPWVVEASVASPMSAKPSPWVVEASVASPMSAKLSPWVVEASVATPPTPGLEEATGPAETFEGAVNCTKALEDVRRAEGSEPKEGRASSNGSPMEWEREMHTSWQVRKAQVQMNQWLGSLEINGFVTGMQKLNIASDEFLSGDGHVDAEKLLPPPEHEVTLPNPEKANNTGQSSNVSMLVHYMEQLRRKLAESEEECIRLAARPKPERPRLQSQAENPHAPKINIHVRFATPADLPACLTIYNHYVRNSVVASEIRLVEPDHFKYRLDDIYNLRLPWLVAVHRPKRINRSVPRHQQAEKIVGYALAEDHSDVRDAYRYTVEMQIFVHHDHLRLGVGRTLMDRIVCALDPYYVSRGGYRSVDKDDPHRYETPRVLSKILCLVPYCSDDRSQMEWRKKWLESWQFAEVGDLREIGYKHGKWLSVVYLEREIPRAAGISPEV